MDQKIIIDKNCSYGYDDAVLNAYVARTLAKYIKDLIEYDEDDRLAKISERLGVEGKISKKSPDRIRVEYDDPRFPGVSALVIPIE